MKKALLLAVAAGGLLVGFSPPGPAMPGDEGVDYPPCSRAVRDRCIQLHERGVATPENLAANRGDAGPGDYADGPPPRDDRPELYARGPDDDMPPPPGRHHHGMGDDGPSEMESVVAPPPPQGEPVRYAMNDYPPCADAGADRCVQRRVVVVHRERMLRIGERG